MTAPILTVRDYALALFGALCAAGVDAQQASDCANNAARPIVVMPEYTVAEIISSSLRTQRAVGYVVSDATINKAMRACSAVPRFADPLPAEDARRALPDRGDEIEPACGDVVCPIGYRGGPLSDEREQCDHEMCAVFGSTCEPRRVDSDRSPRSAEVGRAPLAQRFAELPAEQRQGVEGFARLAQMGGVK